MEEAARTLARKVCASVRQSPLEIRWLDAHASPSVISDSLKKAFLFQLSACGIDASKASGIAVLTTTARITASKFLLIADWESSPEPRRVFIVEIPRTAVRVSTDWPLAPQLRREMLWRQEKPISSAVEWYDDSTKQEYLFLLSEGSFVRLHFGNNSWTQVDSMALPKPEHPIRGENDIFVNAYPNKKLAVLSSGRVCPFEPLAALSFSCSNTDIGVQGKVSTIASSCDQTPHVLSTDGGDYMQRDRIILDGAEVNGATVQDSEISSRSIDFPGPVLDISNGNDLKTATAVVRNLSTGNYEIYRITALCSN